MNWLRGFIKSLIFEFTSPFILFLFVHEWAICWGYFGVRVVMLFLYLRLWKYVKWGKLE